MQTFPLFKKQQVSMSLYKYSVHIQYIWSQKILRDILRLSGAHLSYIKVWVNLGRFLFCKNISSCLEKTWMWITKKLCHLVDKIILIHSELEAGWTENIEETVMTSSVVMWQAFKPMDPKKVDRLHCDLTSTKCGLYSHSTQIIKVARGRTGGWIPVVINTLFR